MYVATILLSAALAAPQQLPTTPEASPQVAPVPAEAQPPPPADPAPADVAADPAPADQPVEATPPPEETPMHPKHWRVVRVDGPVPAPGQPPPPQEVMVVRADGSQVTVGEGLGDIKQGKRLIERARKLEDAGGSVEALVGKIVILSAGGGLAVVGVGAGLVGGVLWLLSSQGALRGADSRVANLGIQGPSILVSGVIAVAIGMFTVCATAAMWIWQVVQGAPPPDPVNVSNLSNATTWSEKEAMEVVEAHNKAVDAQQGLPPASPGPQPYPEPQPSPEPAPLDAPPPAMPMVTDAPLSPPPVDAPPAMPPQ